MNFTGQTLENVDMSGKDLSGAILTNAHIFSCNFTNTNLTDVIAVGTHFYDTDFTNATFKNAYLARAQFTLSTFKKTDLWNVAGDGIHIISLQLGGYNICYTSEILQIKCLQFDLPKIWWMTDEEVLSRSLKRDNRETIEIARWWHKWKSQIYQIVNSNPAKPVNSPN